MSDNDTLIDGFGGSTAPELSAEELQKREQAFNKRVRKQIAVMMSPAKFKEAQRTDAARMLGEYGEPTSIPYLTKTYQNDKSKAVRQAAAHSLGMLKTLGETLTSGDAEMEALATEMIHNIILKNQLGRPARFSARGVRLLSFVLILIGVMVGVFALLQAPRVEDPTLVSLEQQLTRTAAVITPSAVPTSSDPEVLLGQFRDSYTALDSNSRILQSQLLTITRQQPQDCEVELAPSSQYSAPDVLTSIDRFDEAVVAFNVAEAALSPVQAAFRRSCSSDQSIPREEALTLSQQVVEAQRQLGLVAPILAAIGVSVPATPTLISVPTNTETPTETPTPTATVDAGVINTQILSMENVINDMVAARGKAILLQSYWQNVQGGSANDCLQMPPPAITADIIVDEKALALAPDLQSAADSLNSGLNVIRNSYTAFNSGCETNTLSQLVGTQIAAVQTAINSLNDAQTRLNDIKASLR